MHHDGMIVSTNKKLSVCVFVLWYCCGKQIPDFPENGKSYRTRHPRCIKSDKQNEKYFFKSMIVSL